MKPRFQLVIEAKPDPGDPGAVRALRRLLKTLLRSHHFRCVTARPVDAVHQRPEPATKPPRKTTELPAGER
jgi:hypothetical protein